MEYKSKEEIARDVEQTRLQAKRVLKEAGEVWSGKNAVASAWRSTKGGYFRAQDKVAQTAETTDEAIRTNIYTSLGVALGVGMILGLLTRNKSHKARRNKNCECD